MIEALVENPHVSWERYLHQLVPVVITCLVRRQVGAIGEDHWTLRRHAARVLAAVCASCEEDHAIYGLETKVARSLVTDGLLDSRRALTSHFGATSGIAALGPTATENMLLPHLWSYMPTLGIALLPSNENVVKRFEAFMCLDAILLAVGTLVHTSEYNAQLKRKSVWATVDVGSDPPRSAAAVGSKGSKALQGEKGEGGSEESPPVVSIKGQRPDERVVGEFADGPAFGSANVVTYAHSLFGERVLPFLHNEYLDLVF